jgi:hypothetical protein
MQITHTHKTKYATQEERDGKAKEGTLSPCRKTAAASRDGDTRHEQNGGSVPVGAIFDIRERSDLSLLRRPSASCGVRRSAVLLPLRPLLTPVEMKKEGQKNRELDGSAGTGPAKGPRNKRSA